MGFIASPHTSAGRVPTPRGYRFFVDTLMTIQPLEERDATAVEDRIRPDQPQRVISAAAQVLSNLSQFAGVVMTPRRDSSFRHIEFLSLSESRVLLIIVTPDGDVQNRILFPERAYTQSQLIEAANFLNQHFAGQSFESIKARLRDDLDALRHETGKLMEAAVDAGSEAMADDSGMVFHGERNLLENIDLSANMAEAAPALPAVRAEDRLHATPRRVEPGRRRADLHRRRVAARADGRHDDRDVAVHGRRPHRRHARRDRTDADGLRARGADRRHHREAAVERVEPALGKQAAQLFRWSGRVRRGARTAARVAFAGGR